MALCARNLRVQTGQRVARLRVIELRDADRLPVRGVVALQTIRTQLTFVFILMTGGTRGRNSKECVIQIFGFDGRSFRGRNLTRRVALITA